MPIVDPILQLGTAGFTEVVPQTGVVLPMLLASWVLRNHLGKACCTKLQYRINNRKVKFVGWRDAGIRTGPTAVAAVYRGGSSNGGGSADAACKLGL
jgi:hypothetical protein